MSGRGWQRRGGGSNSEVQLFIIIVFISVGFVYKHSDWVPACLRGLRTLISRTYTAY